MRDSMQDVRYAWRILRQSPGVTLIAVLSLALGIGGNSTMFSVIHEVLLKDPPYARVERLVTIWSTDTVRQRGAVATGDFLDWRKQTRSFEQIGLAGFGGSQATMTDSGVPERVRWQPVTANLFNLLGVQPVLGRSFPEEAGQGGVPVLLSDSFWQRRFNADPAVLGRGLTIAGRPAAVIGVMPKGFQVLDWGGEAQIWYPLDLAAPEAAQRKIPWLACIGRLKPSATILQAQAEMSAIAQQLEQAYPDSNKGRGVLLEPLRQTLTGGLKGVLYPLFAAVGFVLLIACANVANLLLARAGSRRREIVVRAALGANRLRLVRQLLTESVIVAACGGVLGLGTAFGGIRLFQTLAPAWIPVRDAGLNLPVAIFTLGISAVTGVLAGLVPALQASRPDLNESLKEGARGSGGRGQGRTRAALAAGEVSLALVLLAGAGLMLNSLMRLLRVEPGFQPASLLTMKLDLSGPKYVAVVEKRDIAIRSISPQVEPFYDRVLESSPQSGGSGIGRAG